MMATEKDKTIQDAVEEICTLARLSPKAAYGLKFRKILEAIREAARADAIEECAQLTDEMRYSCRDWPVEHECDYFGCGDLEELAKALRSLSRKELPK